MEHNKIYCENSGRMNQLPR